ncbi:hypothetical protein CALCODRAFT_280959 [Calocera cornea HHB12733]|uniref:Uncharacterized protein n=1 Tax=Calocera cornea HHB12733 TaxID=1353952 RepID=A0A165G0G1_9BASI|nr:hypothetical protein CALCODRAFT_280959 [Calocera cornea HHB12733]
MTLAGAAGGSASVLTAFSFSHAPPTPRQHYSYTILLHPPLTTHPTPPHPSPTTQQAQTANDVPRPLPAPALLHLPPGPPPDGARRLDSKDHSRLPLPLLPHSPRQRPPRRLPPPRTLPPLRRPRTRPSPGGAPPPAQPRLPPAASRRLSRSAEPLAAPQDARAHRPLPSRAPRLRSSRPPGTASGAPCLPGRAAHTAAD